MEETLEQRLGGSLSRIEARLGMDAWFSRDIQERQLLLAGRAASWAVRSRTRLKCLSDAEFRVTSQWGEDGIIDWLVERLPIANRTFIEFGVENYREANTRFLLQNRNWRGLVLDGSDRYMADLRSEALYWRHDVIARPAFVTPDNINGLIAEAGLEGDIGLLSVDIDGNDYWVLDAITQVSPRILVVEYNPILGDQHAVVVPYRADFDRLAAHSSGLYFGASIAAIISLASRKGYAFLGTCSNGINAFFVRQDLFHHVDGCLEEKRAWPALHRDSRDENGRLTYTRGAGRFDQIKHLPVVLPEQDGRIVRLEELTPVYGAEWWGAMESVEEETAATAVAQSTAPSGIVTSEVSVGELIDKMTILKIKLKRLSDPAKQENVARELSALEMAYKAAGLNSNPTLIALESELRAVNEAIWDSEDTVRIEMRRKDFGAAFVAATRASHEANEERALIKRRLNEAANSRLMEEKSYWDKAP